MMYIEEKGKMKRNNNMKLPKKTTKKVTINNTTKTNNYFVDNNIFSNNNVYSNNNIFNDDIEEKTSILDNNEQHQYNTN